MAAAEAAAKTASDAKKLRSEDERKLKVLIAADTARKKAVRAAEDAKKLGAKRRRSSKI